MAQGDSVNEEGKAGGRAVILDVEVVMREVGPWFWVVPEDSPSTGQVIRRSLYGNHRRPFFSKVSWRNSERLMLAAADPL